MIKITEAQIEEAMLNFQQEMDIAAARDAAEERYVATVAECNFNDCIHFDTRSGHCPLAVCFYDQKEYETEPDVDEWEEGGFEWVE